MANFRIKPTGVVSHEGQTYRHGDEDALQDALGDDQSPLEVYAQAGAIELQDEPDEPQEDTTEPTGNGEDQEALNTSADSTGDPLPEDFPHAGRLREAGVETFQDLQEVEDLTALEGIGQSRADEIQAALDEEE